MWLFQPDPPQPCDKYSYLKMNAKAVAAKAVVTAPADAAEQKELLKSGVDTKVANVHADAKTSAPDSGYAYPRKSAV